MLLLRLWRCGVWQAPDRGGGAATPVPPVGGLLLQPERFQLYVCSDVALGRAPS